MGLDLDLDIAHQLGWISYLGMKWIWVRIGYCSWVGLDFKSVLYNGFGFGFSITLRLSWIMDLIYFSHLDLVLVSV